MPTLRRTHAVLLWLCGGLWCLASEPHRVFDPPRLPQDARLQLRWHLDHPAPFTGEFPSREAWEKRASQVREQILVSQGLWPMPAKCPLNPVVHGKIDRDDYTIEKVAVTSWPGHYVTGNLYRPKGRSGKLPAVLSPHGHYANGRLMQHGEAEVTRNLQSGAESMRENAMYPLQARCATLARMGCVVFFFDMVGYADSTAIPHRAGFNSVECELQLQSAMGLQTWNCIRALDFLVGLPEIDSERIAVTGSSGGGTQTFLLAAIDPRVKLSAPAVMVSMNMQGGCICENASHLRVGTNNVEIAALFAPKPMLLPSAQDWTHDIEKRGLPELRQVYRLYGAEDKVQARFFPYPHGYHQPMREYLYHFLNVHFKLGLSEPIKEKPFLPVPPNDLRVFDKKHPRPADELDAANLSRSMAVASDQQLRDLAKNPDELKKVLRTGLRVMLHDEAPQIGSTLAKQTEVLDKGSYYIWKGTQSRKGEQEEIPTLAIVPRDNKGEAVVWIHPQGKASLFDAQGALTTTARQLLDAKYAIIAPDLFLTGEYHIPDKSTAVPWRPQPHHRDIPFAGFVFGYNRCVVAEQVRDIHTVVAHLHTRKDVKRVHLVAFGDLATCGLLARASAGDLVDKAILSFPPSATTPKSFQDTGVLPGLRKYGGPMAFALLSQRSTNLFNAPHSFLPFTMLSSPHLLMHPQELREEALVELLK